MSFYAMYIRKLIRENKINRTVSLPGIKPESAETCPPNGCKQRIGRRAAFYTLKKAGITVETAAVLPLFLLCCLAIFSMLEVFGIYLTESMKLREESQKNAMYAYRLAQAEDGKKGFSDGYISMTKMISYRVPFCPVPLPAIRIPCYARVHAWIGYDEYEGDAKEPMNDRLVFVSDYESVYHTSAACTYLDLEIRQETLSDARNNLNSDGIHLRTCEKCIGDGTALDKVYVTNHGHAYHNSSACSGLKRSSRLVWESDLGQLSCCSRCQAIEKGGTS